MNARFPVPSALSYVLRVLGWLVFAGGVLSSLKQLVALAQCLPNCSVDIPWLLENVALLVFGVVTIVSGEIIGVVFAIEGNTRRLVELQERPPAVGTKGWLISGFNLRRAVLEVRMARLGRLARERGPPLSGSFQPERSVILSEAKDLHLSVFKGDNADASLRSA